MNRLYDTIKYEIKHHDYDRNVKLASDYFAFYTGKGLDEKLEQIVRREDKDMFEQRVKLTHHIIPPLNNSLKIPFFKVPRSQGVHMNLEAPEQFYEVTDAFWHNTSIKHYFENRYIDLTWIDPNCWLFIENGSTDGTHYPEIYVYEIPSKNAIDYKYTRGTLDYIIALELKQKQVIIDEKLKVIEYEHWTYYSTDETIILDEDITVNNAKDDVNTYLRGEFEYIDINKKAYKVTRITPSYKEIPCKRIGFIHDNMTDGRTFVSPMNPAIPFYNKLLKSVSELDLTSSLHNFPQKIESIGKCMAAGCNGGIDPEGKECSVCGGTGYQQTHTSAQDVVQVALPNLLNGEQQFDLDNVVKYLYLPSEAMTMQINYINDLKLDSYRAIYNSEIFTKQEVSDTATGRNIDMQSVYDTLYPFAVKYVADQEYIYKKIKEITGLKIEFSATVEKDFKLKSYEDLLFELKTAKDAGASADVIEKINDNIAEAFYQDDNIMMERYKTQKAFDPFNAKTPEQTISIVSTLPINDKYRVSWTFREIFFDELEMEHEDYYKLAMKRRRDLFNEKVAARVVELTEINTPLDFG